MWSFGSLFALACFTTNWSNGFLSKSHVACIWMYSFLLFRLIPEFAVKIGILKQGCWSFSGSWSFSYGQATVSSC